MLPSPDLRTPLVHVARRRMQMLLDVERLILRFIAQTAVSTKQNVAEIVEQVRPVIEGQSRSLLIDLVTTAISRRYDEESQAHLAVAQRILRRDVFDAHLSNEETPSTRIVELLDDAMRAQLLSPLLSEWPRAISLALYPRAAAHVICGSLGYATADHAARIVANAHDRKPDFCEWIDSCVRPQAGRTYQEGMAWATHQVVVNSLSNQKYQSPRRKRHSGHMADYTKARVVVIQELLGKTPAGTLAAWF